MTSIDKRSVEIVFERLSAANPDPRTELVSVNDYTLLVAVVLSAQMTDKGVNRATEDLFRVADTPEKMLELGEEGLRGYIKSINLYPTKARHVIALSRMIIERFGGKIPSTREELESLPGVGGKTASVILNVVFGKPTIPVDTHLLRLSKRLGLSFSKSPRDIEADLLRLVPERFRLSAHHWLLLHGRYVCTARKPRCDECAIADLCPKNGLE